MLRVLAHSVTLRIGQARMLHLRNGWVEREVSRAERDLHRDSPGGVCDGNNSAHFESFRCISVAIQKAKGESPPLPFDLRLRELCDSFLTSINPPCAARIHALPRVALACAICMLFLCATEPARARVMKVQITERESPTFGGYSWPGVGQYEKIVGKAFGDLDPKDPKNAVIVDLQLAPKNAKGLVEYSFDFYILKPIDLTKGNHKMLYEPPNRGRKTIAAFNRGVGGNDPGSVRDASLLGNCIPDASGLFDLLQWLGRFGRNEYGRSQHDHHAAGRPESRWLVNHGSRI